MKRIAHSTAHFHTEDNYQNALYEWRLEFNDTAMAQVYGPQVIADLNQAIQDATRLAMVR